jgi:predicted Zn-dependent protease
MSMPSDLTLFDARYSDGRTAAATPVQARLAETGLEILVPGDRRTRLTWPYGELRSGAPLRAKSADVLLSLGPAGSQTLFVPDPRFSRLLLARAKFLSAGRQRFRGLRTGVAAVAVVALVAGAVRLFDFHPAQTMARMLPQKTREAMGRNVVASLTGTMRQCHTPAGRAALDRLTQRLTGAASKNPPAVRVALVDWHLVNAFAAPGGQLILTRGLVQKAASPDEVAGVLAHELGHALELHPEAGLVRAMGLAAAAQLIFAGSTGTATNIGLLLTQLRYTRVAEREADAHALRILKNAAISAKGFGDFFERLEPKRPSDPVKADPKKNTSLTKRIFSSEILRTHPLTEQRLALVRAQPPYPATPALADEEWRALRDMCGASPTPPRPARPAEPTATPAPPPPPTVPPGNTATADADREIAEATKALEAIPFDVAALQRRARAYTRKGQHAEALADLVKAVELRPSDPGLHSARGLSHYNLRQFELAVAAYDEALRLDPKYTSAYNGRGNANRALKRYDAALGDFDALVRARPGYVYAYYNRGLTYSDMGRREDAMRDFTSALGLDKDYAGAYAHRGLLHEKAGARDLAIADFRAALAAPVDKYGSGPWAHRTARARLKALGVATP